MRHRGIPLIRLFVIGALILAIAIAPSTMSQNPVVEERGTPVGWSDNIKLTDNGLTHVGCSMATDQDNIHVVWEQWDPGPSDDYIVYKKSNDNGITWESSVNISNTDFVAVYPDIDVSNQNIHVVWEDYRSGDAIVYYRNSTDGGDNWNSIRRIPSPTIYAAGPSIFVNDSNVHIFWWDGRNNWDGEIYYRRSLDGGITFDNGQGLDQDRRVTFSPAPIGGPWVGGDGSNISVVWYDERDGDWEIYWMISKDNGFTWEDGLGTPNVGRKLTDTTDDSIYPVVAVNGSQIHIVWVEEQWPGPEYRLYYRNSTDNGLSWNTPQLLTGPVPGINSPDIDVVGDNVYIVWDDERDNGSKEEIYYKYSNDSGISWSIDIRLTFGLPISSYHPRIDVVNDTQHVAWYSDEIYYKRSPDFPPDPTYNITLDEGWNLVSLPLEQPDESLDQVLQSINGKWDYIQVYDAVNEIWLSNATFKPDQLNDFNTLNHRQGFWINITEPGGTILSISGYDPPSTSIPLYAGWNLVGYPSLVNETVANALWGTGADRVEVYNATAPYRIKEVGPTYVMKPGEGYWVHVPADTVWTVNW